MPSSLFNSATPPPNMDLLSLLRSKNVPQSVIMNVLQSNPNYNYIMNLISQYNGNAEQAFYALAREKGIDPNQFLNSLK